MIKINIIEHTADKGIHVEAESLPELFQGALEGMANIQKKHFDRNQPATHEQKIEIQSPDRTALLIDFLSDIHTLSDIYGILFTEFKAEELSDTHLTGTIKGHKTDRFDEDIKAVTHSQADIRENKEGRLETIVVFDI